MGMRVAMLNRQKRKVKTPPAVQLPLTLLHLAVLPLCWQTTCGAPLLPAQEPALHVAVHTVPLVLFVGQLKVALGRLVGRAEHTAGIHTQQAARRQQDEVFNYFLAGVT
jgi:hypothetical protein